MQEGCSVRHNLSKEDRNKLFNIDRAIEGATGQPLTVQEISGILRQREAGFQNVPDIPGGLNRDQAGANISRNPTDQLSDYQPSVFPQGSPGFNAMFGGGSVNEMGRPVGIPQGGQGDGFEKSIHFGPDNQLSRLIIRRIQQQRARSGI